MAHQHRGKKILLRRPSPPKGQQGQVFAFVVVGILSVAVDTGLLYILHDLLHQSLRPSIVAGQTAGLSLNFTLNKFVFAGKTETRLHRHMARYAAMVGANYAVTLVVVPALATAQVSYIISKLVTVAVMSVVNLYVYRRWVFA